MKSVFKRFLSGFLSVLLLLSSAPLSGFVGMKLSKLGIAEKLSSVLSFIEPEARAADENKCGDNLTWNFEDGVLTITGDGGMYGYYIDEAPWSEYKDSITEIIFSGKITSIGDFAFANCSNLQSVTIPETVKHLGACFICGTSISAITIPKSIGIDEDEEWYYWDDFGYNGPFAGCSTLTTVTLEEGISAIPDYLFASADYTSNITSVDIPKTVSYIGYRAFYDCDSLSKITLNYNDKKVTTESSGLQNFAVTIGDEAFAHCDKLKTVVLTENVTSIGNRAFWGCSSLASLALPERVEYIGERFIYSTSVTNVTIPANLLTCGYSGNNGPFAGCNTLKTIELVDGLSVIPAYLFASGDYSSSITTINIPKTVNSIGYRAFYNCTALTKVVLNYNDKKVATESSGLQDFSVEIEAEAFFGCKSLNTVTLTENVTSIGDNAFWGCANITSLNLPERLTHIGASFIRGTSISKLTIPKNIKTCGSDGYENGPLAGCSALKTVTLEDGLAVIPECFFASEGAGCSITSINIPKTVSSIGYRAFYNCKALEKAVLNYNDKKVATESSGLQSFSVTISDEAFRGCSSLKTVTLTENVTSIGNGAFWGCANLKNLTLPESVTHLGACFITGSSISALVIPKNIGKDDMDEEEWYYWDEYDEWGQNGPFAGCTSLKTVTLEEGLSEIPDYFFASADYTSNITSVNIPKTVSRVGAAAFYNCKSLTNIVLNYNDAKVATESSGLQKFSVTIGQEAFHGCSALKTVTLTENVTSIGNRAFWGCSNLESLILPESVTYLGERFIYGTSVSEITIPKNVSSVGNSDVNGPLAGCETLKEVVFEAGITNIPAYICSECSSLISVTLPENKDVREFKIGDYAFYRCIRLSDITIPGNVTEIGRNAFYGCTNLGTVLLPDSLTTIGYNAFSDAYIRNLTIASEDSPVALMLIDNEIPYSAVETGIKDSDDKYLDRDKTTYYSSTGAFSASGQLTLTAKYDFKDFAKRNVSDLQMMIRIPSSARLVENSVVVNGEAVEYDYGEFYEDYYYDEETGEEYYDYYGGTVVIGLPDNSGTVSLSVTPGSSDYLMTYAKIDYYYNGRERSEVVGVMNMAATVFTFNAPTETSSPLVSVNGVASPEQEIRLYVGDDQVATVTASKTGSYSKSIRIPGAVSGEMYQLSAKTTVRETEKTISSYVIFNAEAVHVTQFDMYYNDNQSSKMDLLAHSGKRVVFTWVPGTAFTFVISFDKNENVKNVSISSTKGSEVKTLDAVWDPEKNAFIASGFFDPSNHDYVIGSISAEYESVEHNVLGEVDVQLNEVVDSSVRTGYEVHIDMPDIDADAYYKEEMLYNVRFTPTDDYVESTYEGKPCYIGKEMAEVTDADSCFLMREMYILDNAGTYTLVRYGIGTFAEEASAETIQKDSLKVQLKAKPSEYVDFVKKTRAVVDILNTYKQKDSVDVKYQIIYEYINTIETSYSESLSPEDELELTQIKSGVSWHMINNTGINAEEMLKHAIKDSATLSSDPSYVNVSNEMQNCVNSMKNAISNISDSTLRSYIERLLKILKKINEKLKDQAEKDLNGINNKEQIDTTVNTQAAMDPSGFVYEAVPSNRIEGVTTTIYYKDSESGAAILWDAAEYEQLNPLTTDYMGCYAWDVPEGAWQVKYEKSGYTTAYSEWMPVPPPQFNVNIGLVSKAAPTVEFVNVYQDEVQIKFSQYMDTDSITSSNVTFTCGGKNVTGAIEAVDGEKNYDGSKEFATTFSFVPDSRLSGDVAVKISEVKNYAGKAIASAYNEKKTVVARIVSLTVPEYKSLNYKENGTIEVFATPASAAAGKKVLISTNSPYVAELSATEVELDADGKASVGVKTLLPGNVDITFLVEDTTVSATTNVAVVLVPVVEAEQIALDVRATELEIGKTIALTATVNPDTADDKSVKWKSGDESVATVDENGVVTAIAAGTAIITASTANGRYEASCTVTVKASTVEYIPGDVDGNGKILANDARLALRASAQLEKLDELQFKAADVDGNGKVLANDARQILRFSAQLIKAFEKAA